MDKDKLSKIMQLKTVAYECPNCYGKKHFFNRNLTWLKCDANYRSIFYGLTDTYLRYDNDQTFPVTKVHLNNNEPSVTFTLAAKDGTHRDYKVFFDEKEYFDILNEDTTVEDSIADDNNNETKTENNSELKEKQIMTTELTHVPTTPENTTIKNWLLDTTPRQKGQAAINLFEEHKDVLQWTIPIACIYAAYKVLEDKSSGISIENADEIFTETFGESSPYLSNSVKMKKLLKRGSAIALGYSGVKIASSFTNKSKEQVQTVGELEETIEAGISQISKSEKLIKSFAPNAQDLVPAAVSVLILFVLKNPMNLEFLDSLKNKVEHFPNFIKNGVENAIEWGKDMLVEHFNIDVESPEFRKNSKKILILVAILAVVAFIFGQDIFSKNKKTENNQRKIKDFINYLMDLFDKIAPTVFAGIVTILIAGKWDDNEPTQISTKPQHEDFCSSDEAASTFDEHCESNQSETSDESDESDESEGK